MTSADPSSVICGYCHARAGSPCRVGYTGLTAKRPHKRRIKDAAATPASTTDDAPCVHVGPWYPNCSECGHNASAVVAFTCTAFVPYPEGDPRGHAGYCGHRCVNDPAIKAWIGVESGELP